MRRIVFNIFPLALLLLVIAMPLRANGDYNKLRLQLNEVAKSIDAEVGIAIISDGDTLTVNNGTRYPMMSVFKFHQALAVADCMIRRNISLDSTLLLTRADLPQNTYSPLRDEHNEECFYISIKDLLTYTLQRSDNNACDILFKRIVTPNATDQFIRSLGITGFSISQTEADMHRDINSCYLNWTTPLSASFLLEAFYYRLSKQDSIYAFIKETMENCQTGQDRLKKPFIGSGIVIGHKTGTSDKNDKGEFVGINDIGFITLQEGRTYFISVFIKDCRADMETASAAISRISELTYRFLKQTETQKH